MKIELLNQIQLDESLANQPHSQFLQSWDWGEFQKAMGHGIWRLGVLNDDNQLIASAQIIQNKLLLKKSYLYCARGPVFDEKLTDGQKQEILKLILSKARDITILTSQTEEIFIRLEPSFEIRNSKFEIHQTRPVQPATTLILDLTQSDEQLLAQMHPKTRYNIKVAKRHGVVIAEEKDFDNVWPFFLETAKRDKFNIHPKSYYQKMLEIIPWIKLLTAKHQDKLIAGVIISYFGDTITYLHGASDYHYRSLMAPYLLHWKIILTGKQPNNQIFYQSAPKAHPTMAENSLGQTCPLRFAKQGGRGPISLPSARARDESWLKIIKYYDMYGIAPDDDPKKSWAGITRFKTGFGGQVINYPGTFDFIYQPGWYKIYKTLRTINLFLRKI